MKKKILIISANYYKNISIELESSAFEVLIDKKDNDKKYKVDVLEVPGVFEIPVMIAKNIKKYDGFLALGCVIKGETPHFDFISQTSIDAIMKLSIENKKPIGNGIITCFNMKQAEARKEKGREAAKAVLSVLSSKKWKKTKDLKTLEL